MSNLIKGSNKKGSASTFSIENIEPSMLIQTRDGRYFLAHKTKENLLFFCSEEGGWLEEADFDKNLRIKKGEYGRYDISAIYDKPDKCLNISDLYLPENRQLLWERDD